MAIGQDEREFFVQLGARMAELRKRLGITQVQMSETLGISQQTVNAYEAGQRRVPAPALQRHMERISALPKAQQKFVLQVLESVLQQGR